MSKITKKDRITHLELQVGWLTNVVHELRGTENLEFEPQLKQLDQSIFEGVFDWVKSAAVNPDGSAYLFSVGKDDFYNISDKYGFQITGRDKCKCIGLGYDTSNWQNSLIERETAELMGSDLARTYFESNDRHVCFVGEDNDDCLSDLVVAVVIGYNEYRGFETSYNDWFPFAMLVNRQGEPLTAADAGL